mmetsp:Transcript_37759/g.79628  ORF Transcript_37759/g.79628 Transcript_37759/m.79628 type:complete len:668 (+) Transcript_37759:142-2145(+)
MMVAVLRIIACICGLSITAASFVPDAPTVTVRTTAPARGRKAISTQLSLALPSKRKDREVLDDREVYSSTRIPRRIEEAAGITGGLGLWRESRRRKGRQVKEKWKSLQLQRSRGRRKRLARRFQNYLLRNKHSLSLESGDAAVEDDEDLFDDDDSDSDEEEDLCFASLDAMRARAGVLRTRLRMRQESLTALERLMGDVELELKRMGWANTFNADAGYTLRTNFMYGQNTPTTTLGRDDADDALNGGSDTSEVMNEFELAVINRKWEEHIKGEHKETAGKAVEERKNGATTNGSASVNFMEEIQMDRMKRRSLKLKNSILLDRIRLQRLESRIVCMESDELGIVERAVGSTLDSLNEIEFERSSVTITAVQRQAKKFVNTFGESTSVLLRKLDRVSSKSGPNNRDYASVTDFVVQETAAGVRIVGNLLSNPSQLSQLVDPDTPALVPHVPAILARLDRLESHVAPILSRVLNNKQHLRSIEPYLDEILERFDDIEPHLPWILDHIDTLAPYTGLLLKHIDELLLYAEVDEYEAGDDNYAFAEQLLPYLEVYVSQLDLVGPHLPLLRPHLPLLLKHNRIKILSPHVGKLFAKGYKDLSASANMDILLYYFGWALRVPLVPYVFFKVAPPSAVSFLANRLPKRLVRGRCCDVSCYVDGDYGKGWNELSK